MPAKYLSVTKRWKNSLAAKQLTYILIFSSIITLLGTIIQLYLEYRADINLVKNQIEQIERVHLESLTGSLWNFNKNQLRIQLNSILSLRDIEYIEISDSNLSVYSAGQLDKSKKTMAHEFKMVFNHDGRDENIGTLRAIVSLEGVYSRLLNRAMVILATQGVKTFFVSMFILFIIHRLVTRHVFALVNHTKKIDFNKSSNKFVLNKKFLFESGQNEIDQLVTALNDMQQRLIDGLAKQRQTDDKLRAILTAIPDLMIVLNSEGRYIDIFTDNPDLLIAPSEELLGRTIHEVMPVENAQPIQDVIDRTLNTRKSQSYEYEFETGNSKKWFSGRTVAFKYQNSDCVLWAARDITDFKQAESDRQKIESQLQQAQKMEAIGTLAGGIAHDFNNMLGVMIGNIELVMDDVPEWNPARHNLEEVKIAGLRAKDVAQQLLSFSRKNDPKQKPVNISPTIKASLKFLRSSIPTNIEIRRTIPDESGIILADPTQIHQVMLNLCTNAAHAMYENGGIMDVGLSVIEIGKDEANQNIELNQGQYVKITVSDTGHGIAKEHLEKIFNPYFTTKAVGKGSGIGLSVVHGIVKSHNGSISVDSEYGKGTTFNVLLPVVEKAPVYEKETDTIIPTGNERILFVDDEKAIANMTSQMLERLGYTVTTKTCSTNTLETFRSQPDNFDLIISDMSMPKITGDKLANELQKIRPNIPIILCTGYSDRINDEKAKSIGVRALAMKPITKSVLAKTIRKVLD